MADEKRTARFQTAGGWFIELDLPLTKLMKDQYDRGELKEVDEEGNVLPEDQRTPVDGTPKEDEGDGGTVAPGKPTKSGKGSGVEAWRAYALSVDPDLTPEAAEEMTRDDLIARYGEDE